MEFLNGFIQYLISSDCGIILQHEASHQEVHFHDRRIVIKEVLLILPLILKKQTVMAILD